MRKRITTAKKCYCYTCDKAFHYLGVPSHRAMHKRRKENCEITFTHGDTYKWNYANDKNKCVGQ